MNQWTGVRLALVLLVSVVLAGCSTEDESGDHADSIQRDVLTDVSDVVQSDSGEDTGTVSANAIIEPSCGPDDGPALRIVVVTAPASCGLDLTTTGHLSFAVYDGASSVMPITPPQTVQLGQGADGWASRCDGLGSPVPCADATQATLTLETFDEGVGASGTWTADFGSGQETGSFSAVWCEADPPLMCG